MADLDSILGNPSDSEAASGNGTLIALVKSLRTKLSAIAGGLPDGVSAKRAFANIAASQTDASVVAAVTGKKLRVLSVAFVAGGTATNLTFNSKGAGSGTAISALFANAANGGAALTNNPHGWFETAVGEALTVTTGAGSSTGIQLTYVEV